MSLTAVILSCLAASLWTALVYALGLRAGARLVWRAQQGQPPEAGDAPTPVDGGVQAVRQAVNAVATYVSRTKARTVQTSETPVPDAQRWPRCAPPDYRRKREQAAAQE
jgi:hypothetical protein